MVIRRFEDDFSFFDPLPSFNPRRERVSRPVVSHKIEYMISIPSNLFTDIARHFLRDNASTYNMSMNPTHQINSLWGIPVRVTEAVGDVVLLVGSNGVAQVSVSMPPSVVKDPQQLYAIQAECERRLRRSYEQDMYKVAVSKAIPHDKFTKRLKRGNRVRSLLIEEE